MNKRKRILAMLLAAVIVSSFVSCGGSGSGDVTSAPDSDSGKGETTASPYDSNGFLLDSLPDELDFGGRKVTILGWDHYEEVEFYTEEQTGDIVNDAYYQRNLGVEDRLNVKLEFLEGLTRGSNDFRQKISNSVMSGSGEYDIIAGHSQAVSQTSADGLLLNVLDIDYIDFDKPWWAQSLKKETTIGGALYFLAGDIAVSTTSRMQGLFFNNDYIVDYKLEDPYDVVLDGKWTVDKMFEMSKDIYSDLNSDGKKDEKDQFGFACDWVQFQAPMYSCGIKAVDVTKDGGLEVSPTFTGEKAADLLVKLCGFVHDTNDATKIAQVDDSKIFIEGRVLFYAFPLGLISTGDMRSVKFSYGFIPWPKYDESQENYIVSSSNAFSLWAVPIDAKDSDISGAVMEAMASGGYRLISPALFETAYKVKYNSMDSERQSQVFDILKSSVIYDVGKVYGNLKNNMFNNYCDMIFNNNTNWKSNVDSKKDAMQASLDEMVETFRENAAG